MIGKSVIIHVISVSEKLNLGERENGKLIRFTKVNEIIVTAFSAHCLIFQRFLLQNSFTIINSILTRLAKNESIFEEW